VARDGIRPFGATGAVTGGGVRAFQIDHPASFGGRLEGMGAKAGRIFGMGYRRCATDAISDAITRADHRVNEG